LVSWLVNWLVGWLVGYRIDKWVLTLAAGVTHVQKCPLVLLPVLHTKVRHLDRQRQQVKV